MHKKDGDGGKGAKSLSKEIASGKRELPSEASGMFLFHSIVFSLMFASPKDLFHELLMYIFMF